MQYVWVETTWVELEVCLNDLGQTDNWAKWRVTLMTIVGLTVNPDGTC